MNDLNFSQANLRTKSFKQAILQHNFLLMPAGINVGKNKYRHRSQKNKTGYDLFYELFHPARLADSALFVFCETQHSIERLTNALVITLMKRKRRKESVNSR